MTRYIFTLKATEFASELPFFKKVLPGYAAYDDNAFLKDGVHAQIWVRMGFVIPLEPASDITVLPTTTDLKTIWFRHGDDTYSRPLSPIGKCGDEYLLAFSFGGHTLVFQAYSDAEKIYGYAVLKSSFKQI